MADAADAIVGYAVEHENPGAGGILWTNFPAAQGDAVWRGYGEVFALGVNGGEVGVRFTD